MNIKISYNWLLEYLDTKATAFDLQKYLSLCGPSVERVEKIGDDYVLDIEITSNRVDCASIYGIAREAHAILPQFGIDTNLKKMSLIRPEINKTTLPLTLVNDKKICRRVMAVVLDNVSIGPSPTYMKDRLEKSGIRSLNNIVDITNYIMLEIGHPTHVFDYDRIKSATLKIRGATKNEKITTLDDKKYSLDKEDVVIDDGRGTIIDLPGIMGTANSVVSFESKRIIYFIDSINPSSIRKTSMRLKIRTLAATINEKNPSPELVETALMRGLELFTTVIGATIASKIYDIYPEPYKPKQLSVDIAKIDSMMGIQMPIAKSVNILERLGFEAKIKNKDKLEIMIPNFRASDIVGTEDVVEEIARVYGYHKLPSNIPKIDAVEQPEEVERLFDLENKIKYFLKHSGAHEVYNYSMLSKKQLTQLDLNPLDHLKLSNTISTEIEYLRTSLLPSLIKNIKENEGKRDPLLFFEIAKVYHKRHNDLPSEKRMIGLSTNTDYFDLKGIVESFMQELKIVRFKFQKTDKHHLFSPTIQAEIHSEAGEKMGVIGLLHEKYRLACGLKKAIFLGEFDMDKVADHSHVTLPFRAINPYATIKLDFTFPIPKYIPYEKLVTKIQKGSSLLEHIEFVGLYKKNITLRLFFTSKNRNITEKEAQNDLKKIKELV